MHPGTSPVGSPRSGEQGPPPLWVPVDSPDALKVSGINHDFINFILVEGDCCGAPGNQSRRFPPLRRAGPPYKGCVTAAIIRCL